MMNARQANREQAISGVCIFFCISSKCDTAKTLSRIVAKLTKTFYVFPVDLFYCELTLATDNFLRPCQLIDFFPSTLRLTL
jgi:hypothetical protein